jgi:gas vesicle protein
MQERMNSNGAERSNGATGFLTGLLVGGLTGMVTGLILAPQAGEVTRAQLRERAADLRDTLEDLSTEAQKRSEELREVVESTFGQHLEKGQEVIATRKAIVQ